MRDSALASGAPVESPLFCYNLPLQLVAQICSVSWAGVLHPVRPFSLLFKTFTADLKINHPGTKIPEPRRRSHTCVNFLHHEAQDFAFWDVWDATCFGLSRVRLVWSNSCRLLDKQNYSGLRVRVHLQTVRKWINKLVSLVNFKFPFQSSKL